MLKPAIGVAQPRAVFPPATRGALASLALPMMLSSLGTSSANVALPTLAAVFHATFQQVQWVVLAYLLAVTSVIVGVGRLGDLVGRRRLLLAGVALFTVASALCALAPSLSLLLAARAAQGIGAAAMMALSMALVRDAMPQSSRGRALGLLGTMSALGTALGPSMGGVLMAWLGWPAIFFMNVPPGIAAFFLARNYLAPDLLNAQIRPRFDHAGTGLLAFTLAAYSLAMTLGRGSFGALNIGMLALAGSGLFGFLRIERSAAAPLVQLVMFHDRVLASSLAMSAMVSTVMMATLVVGPFYLSHALGLGAGAIGVVLAVGPIAAALCGVPAGLGTDRFGGSRVTLAGLILLAGGALALALMPLAAGLAGYLAGIVCMTLGYALFQTSNNIAIMARADGSQAGLVAGMLNLARNLGLVTGATAMGSVFAHGVGTWNMLSASPDAVAHGMRMAFGAAAMMIIAALCVALLGLRRDR
ncbi:MAG: MFS transporter [Massilia sp.]|nr:MFS transporter [Massilia sp.]